MLAAMVIALLEIRISLQQVDYEHKSMGLLDPANAAASEMKEGRPSDLLDRISNDDAFGMDRDELDSLVDPHRFIGRAPEQVDRFLDDWVRPLLDRFGADAAQRLGDPDVRV